MEKIHISLQAEPIFYILGFAVTNSIILSIIVGILLVGGGMLMVKNLKLVPGKAQSVAEIAIDGALSFMTQVVGDKKQALNFFPLVASIFFFILLNNWLGVMPGIGSIGVFADVHGHKEFIPLFRPASADLNTTFALAIVAVIGVHIYAIKKIGFFKQVSKFIDIKHGPIHFFVGILEIIGEFAKVLSFSFRLFGNVFAGEVLLIIMLSLLPLSVSFGVLPFFFLEYFVGFIQALVFAMLTLVFLKVATTEVEPMEH